MHDTKNCGTTFFFLTFLNYKQQPIVVLPSTFTHLIKFSGCMVQRFFHRRPPSLIESAHKNERIVSALKSTSITVSIFVAVNQHLKSLELYRECFKSNLRRTCRKTPSISLSRLILCICSTQRVIFSQFTRRVQFELYDLPISAHYCHTIATAYLQ